MWKLSGCLHTCSFTNYSTKLRSATVDYAFSIISLFLSPSSLSGATFILYYYSFSIHFHDHLAIILNVTVGFLSFLYLVLFSFDFGVSGFVLVISLLYPYYVLLLCRLLPVQNFYLFLFYLPCSFFTSISPQKRHNLCLFRPHPCRAQLFILYNIFQFYFCRDTLTLWHFDTLDTLYLVLFTLTLFMLPENCGLAILHKNCFLPRSAFSSSNLSVAIHWYW